MTAWNSIGNNFASVKLIFMFYYCHWQMTREMRKVVYCIKILSFHWILICISFDGMFWFMYRYLTQCDRSICSCQVIKYPGVKGHWGQNGKVSPTYLSSPHLIIKDVNFKEEIIESFLWSLNIFYSYPKATHYIVIVAVILPFRIGPLVTYLL